MSEQTDPLIGTTLNNQYTILEEIGRGGMATVYSAKQQSMNRTVAVKVLPRNLLHDPGFFERFEREVEVISTLEHPHILPIYDYGQSDGIPFITMRYLGGGSMAQMIRRGIPELADIDRPLSQVAQALDYAHQRGIIHRDLKPGNIMLDENGNAYLSDFGIARVMGSDLTGSAIIGTPAYMSPEQANGLPIDGRADVYALGVVLFELITGREPYQAETPMALLLKHINEPIPAIGEFREGVPLEVEDVIQKATAKDPDNRFSSAGEMAKAFSAALRGESIDLSPTRQSAQAATKQVEEAEPLPEAETAAKITDQQLEETIDRRVQEALSRTGEVQKEGGMNRALIGGILVVVVVVAIVGVLALTGGNTPEPTAEPQLLVQNLPTPFARATRIQDDDYSISIPEPWSRQFRDESDINRLLHQWDERNGDAFISLALVEDDSDGVAGYRSRYYEGRVELTLIDEDTAPDGTVRNSYRLEDESGNRANGQIDVFYRQDESTLVVLEVYTSDSYIAQQNNAINTLQLILDSLRVTA